VRPPSVRVRLVLWYLAVLAPATLVLALGSWWLVKRSVVEAADGNLRGRVGGAREFIASMARLSPSEIEDEFREYAELTRGDSLLEVTAASGTVLCKPTLTGWDTLDADRSLSAGERIVTVNRTLQGRPYRVAGATVRTAGETYRILIALPMERADDVLERFQWVLAALLPAVLLVAGAGGYWLSGRALAPVDRMTRAVREISVRNLDRRLDVPAADDELGRLAATFNDMLARVQAAVAEITRLTAEASHELRTPVSLVRTTAEIALDRERPAHDYRLALGEILQQAEQMSVLVEDLLTLARADAGVEPREASSVDLQRVAADVARSVEPAMRARTLTFRTILPAAPLDVVGYEASLRRLLLILLDNAVKYTPPGGEVTLTVVGAAAAATIDVVDTGIGINPDERAHVFDRFYRGAAARQQAADGSGLGLSIARTIVFRHGGTIDIEAGPGGTGCHVRVALPIQAEAANPAADAPRDAPVAP
jgi:two-component system, OmpR family, heavy metal sensor histidine kinase CusS